MSRLSPRIAHPRVRAERFFARFLLVAISTATGVPAPAATTANTAPRIWGTPPKSATQGALYTFRPGASDADGDRLTYSIVNKPKWMWFSTSTGKLTGLPKWAQRDRTFANIVIRVSDGHSTTSLPAFSVTVRSASTNAAPVISGTPPRTASFGTTYYFKPKAFDANGDALKFSISGKPAWASFVSSTGALYGTPTWRDAGKYYGITLKVTDGKATTKLDTFSITVQSPTANRAPTIAGTPPTSAWVGKPYAFKPNAFDPDGDPLEYSISGKPSWGKFDASNGTLYGTPAAGDSGWYPKVTIKVSDGKATTSLAPFSINVSTGATRTVTLTWRPPTANTDGTALTDLAGYRVYYGQASRQYSGSVSVSGAWATSAAIEGLVAGTWYFAIKSINREGVASDYSGEVRASL